MDYYNDNDRHVCLWLHELMRAGLIPEGEIDERPIQEVTGSQLRGYRRVHFFAGIGGWCKALQLAHWPADRPVWTGSCPCQPFSISGKRKGEADERHLWPHFLRLIRECRPSVCLGEQVDGPDGYRWLAGVRADLEAEAYAVGCADLPACSQASPHKRNRLFWVAHARSLTSRQLPGPAEVSGAHYELPERRTKANRQPGRRCQPTGALGQSRRQRVRAGQPGNDAAATSEAAGAGSERQRLRPDAGNTGPGLPVGVVHADSEGPQGQPASGPEEGRAIGRPGQVGSWADTLPVYCADGKWRRVPAEPGFQPVADGLSEGVAARGAMCDAERYPLALSQVGRAALLHGAGNAVVPAVAALFIRAFLEAEKD